LDLLDNKRIKTKIKKTSRMDGVPEILENIHFGPNFKNNKNYIILMPQLFLNFF
jgi:hypothetical protein